MVKPSSILLTLVAMVCTCTAIAQDIRQEKTITLGLASEAAAEALRFCEEKGWKVSVAVVDRSAQLSVQMRADGAGPHTIDSSRRKAFTSASLREGTTAMLDIINKNPAAANLEMIDGFLILGGGLPIRAGGEVIGGIGVGGAPGGHLDDECAAAGIRRIQDRLK
jgi:uncharacterized protein GlcG (DUF336 family)